MASPTSIVVLGLDVASSFLLPVAVGLPLGLSRLRLASGVIIAEPITRLAAGLPLLVLGLNGALAGFTAGNVVAFAINACLMVIGSIDQVVVKYYFCSLPPSWRLIR